LFIACAAHAQTKPVRITLQEENDFKYFSGVDHDRHYTQGLKLEISYPDGDLARAAKFLTRFLPKSLGDCDESARCSSGFVIGQNIYTPQDISRVELQEDERPYAAWLYGGLTLNIRTKSLLQTLEIDVGMMGPAALGRQIQTKWHDVINIAYPRGWRNQIGDEPGVLVQYYQTRRLPIHGSQRRWSSDILTRTGVVAGNVMTYANVAPVVRFGFNMSNDFVFVIPELSLAPPPYEFYVFAGGELRAVAFNEMLEGNCCRDPASHGVRRESIIGIRDVGAVVRYHSIRLTWRQIRRAREFAGQKEPDIYGALALTWDRRF
jgi:hypothetical protein